MADQVTQILTNAQNPDFNVRTEAERQLEAAKEQNFPMFMMTMITELATEGKPEQTRMLAALCMKNSLYAKSEAKRAELQARWCATDEGTRTQVKAGCMQTLSSPATEVRNQACQVIAKIAAAELPQGQWLDVIQTLKGYVVSGENMPAKHGSLVALGYICQEISEEGSDCLESQANDILTAVIQGMRKEETENEIRYVAVQALNNAVEFAHDNFERDGERDYVMTQLCESTQCADDRVRKEAMDCLSNIAYHYYRFLPNYVQAISQLTLKAIKEDKEEVATAAMEFWSTIVDEELALQMSIEDGEEEAGALLNITKQATAFFLPVLLECLTRQQEDEDEDTWTISKAAAVCLGLFAQCAGDDVVELVMQFVNSNVGNTNWIFQDAAIQAFGAILDGPSVEKLTPWVAQAVVHFLDQLVNQQIRVEVRDTTAWAIANILEFCPAAIPPEKLQVLLERLLTSLTDEPRVAVHSCTAFNNLAIYVQQSLEDDEPETTQLSPFTPAILQALVVCANREDADESSNGLELFSCAYEALGMLVQVSGRDMLPLLVQLVPAVLQKLVASFQPPIVSNAIFAHSVQGQCCAMLNQLCQKLPAEQLLPHANDMMQGFLHVFNSKAAEVHTEALLAISAVALAIGAAFLPYMQSFAGPLKAALENTDDYQVCHAAVGVVGDLSRALEKQIAPFSEELFKCLIQLLMNQVLHRSVKPPILSTFGDVALAIGGDFTRFLEHGMTMLNNASRIEIDMSDPDDAEYMHTLRENILEGYSGIIQALRQADTEEPAGGGRYVASLQPYVVNIGFLLQKIHTEESKEGSVVRAALNLMGDLAQAMPAAKPAFAQPWVREFLQAGSQTDGVDQEDVQFAMKIVQ